MFRHYRFHQCGSKNNWVWKNSLLSPECSKHIVLVCPGRGSASGSPRRGPDVSGGGAGRGWLSRPRGVSGRGPAGPRKGRAGRSWLCKDRDLSYCFFKQQERQWHYDIWHTHTINCRLIAFLFDLWIVVAFLQICFSPLATQWAFISMPTYWVPSSLLLWVELPFASPIALHKVSQFICLQLTRVFWIGLGKCNV